MVRLTTIVAGFVLLVSAVHAQDSTSFRLDLILQGTLEGGETVNDFANRIRFEGDALIGWDQHDGSKFIPNTQPYSILSPEGTYNEQPIRQSVRSLPSGLEDPLTVPVAFRTTDPGSFTISAVEVDIPDGWDFILHDLETSTMVNLLDDSYSFDGVVADTIWQERFEIDIEPAQIVAGEDSPSMFHLSNATPNPVATTTSFVLRVEEAQQVTANVYDTLGRVVNSVYNGILVSGEDARLEVEAAKLSTGVYCLRVKGETFSETRRFTVVR